MRGTKHRGFQIRGYCRRNRYVRIAEVLQQYALLYNATIDTLNRAFRPNAQGGNFPAVPAGRGNQGADPADRGEGDPGAAPASPVGPTAVSSGLIGASVSAGAVVVGDDLAVAQVGIGLQLLRHGCLSGGGLR